MNHSTLRICGIVCLVSVGACGRQTEAEPPALAAPPPTTPPTVAAPEIVSTSVAAPVVDPSISDAPAVAAITTVEQAPSTIEVAEPNCFVNAVAAAVAIDGVIGGAVILQSSDLLDGLPGALVGAAEVPASERGDAFMARVAASDDGAIVYAVVDRKGPASDTLQRYMASTGWTELVVGQDINALDASPDGGQTAYSDQGRLTVIRDGAAIATPGPPLVKDPFVTDILFLDDQRLVVGVSEAVAGVDDEVLGLANLWIIDLTSGKWDRITDLVADEFWWKYARSPVPSPDGGFMFVVETGLTTGSQADIVTELWKYAPTGDIAMVGALEPGTLLSGSGPGFIVTSKYGSDGIWQVYKNASDGETKLGCFRVGNAALMNGDPDFY